MIMKTTWLKSSLVATSLSFSATAIQAAMPKVGDTAPLFTEQDQDGKTVKLADFIGKKTCSFRDHLAELAKDNIEVIGVSLDSANSHQRFIVKDKLHFRLLADTNGKITDAYSVRAAGRNLDRTVSFLIGLNRKIVHVTDTGSPDVHLREIKAAVARLAPS